MNIFKNFLLIACMAFTALMSVTDAFLSNTYPQPVVKEILIGPDPSKDGDDVYKPNTITINKGDRVMWVNMDFGIHTVTDKQGSFSSKDLRPDQTFEHIFSSIGTYDYQCRLHPDMTGKIIVN
jgi:plastocyanin